MIAILTVDGITYMDAIVDSTIKGNLMLKLAQKNGCRIQKYFWVSKLDAEYIEYVEPKVYDVFDMEIILIGELEQIERVVWEYKHQVETICFLEKCVPQECLTEQEIKQIALKFPLKFHMD